MKKIKGAILLAFLAFFNIGIVNAGCKDLEWYAKGHFSMPSNIYMHYANYEWVNYTKYILTGNNKDYIAYCRNAGLPSGKVDGSDQAFSCTETIFDPTSDNEDKKAYHAGIMKILTNGYSNLNNNLVNDEDYVATSIALRVYEMLWEKYNTNGSNTSDLNKLHQDIVNKMLADTEIENLVKNAVGTVRDSFAPSKDSYGNDAIVTYFMDDNEIKNNDVFPKAKELIKNGLEAAIDYKKNGAAKVRYTKPQIAKKRKEDGTFEATLSFSLKAEKFGENDSYLNLSFDCPDCNTYGVTYKTYVNDQEMNINGADLLKKRDSNNRIVLKVVFTSNRNYNCETLNYNLKLKYKDKSLLGEAYNMQANVNIENTDIQYFYLLLSRDTVREETISSDLDFDICSLGCEDIKQRCNAGNQEMCNRLDEEYGGDCIKCTAFVSPVKCDENDQELYIKEGLELNSTTESCNANKDSKLNILKCVVNNKDKAENSYKTTDLTNNDYCSVFCKEDYHFVLPGIKEVRSGRYFTLQASVDGSKSCYTSKIDTDTFKVDLEAARQKVITIHNRPNPSVSDLEDLDEAIDNYFSILNSYNACSGYSDASYNAINSKPFNQGWKMTYDYDAKVSFWYQEKYMLDVMSDQLSTVGSVNIDSDYVQTNCDAEVNDDYTCRGNSYTKKEGETSKPPVRYETQYMCIRSGDTYECKDYTVAISNAKYVSQKMGMDAKYITPTQFQKIYPHNAIVVAKKNEEIENGSAIVNGLPVSGATGQGVYTYALKVEDLGEYYDKTKTEPGRIWGDSNSVVVNTLEELNACYKDSSLQNTLDVEDKKISNGVYVCSYRVNCPDCPIECDPDGCVWEDCPTNKCPIECDNCLITNGDYNFDYRPVTPGNLNPNNRPLGSNWNWDKSITDAIELKAYTTTKEIETVGEEIYDTTKDSYIMKVTMDSALISAVREYSDQNDGNYLINTLKCYDLEENGHVYENVFCYSTFLDKMIEEHGDKFKFNKKRPMTEAERKNSSSSDYWTTWTEAVANETWNITTINTVEIAKIDKVDAKSTNYNDLGIGPSWK